MCGTPCNINTYSGYQIPLCFSPQRNKTTLSLGFYKLASTAENVSNIRVWRAYARFWDGRPSGWTESNVVYRVSDPHWFQWGSRSRSGPRYRVLMTQSWQKFTERKKFIFFYYQILQFTYPWASIKDVHCRLSNSPQKRTFSTSKLEISSFFCTSFSPSWIRICIPNADPDLNDQNQCGSMQLLIWNTGGVEFTIIIVSCLNANTIQKKPGSGSHPKKWSGDPDDKINNI